MRGKYQCLDGCGTFNIYIWFSISCGYKLAINHPSEDGEVKDGLINGTFNVMGEILRHLHYPDENIHHPWD